MYSFLNFIEVIENLVLQVLIWIIFLPKTLFKVLWNPSWVPKFVESELSKKENRFSEHVSPVILLTIVALGLFGSYEILGGKLLSSRDASIQGPKTTQTGKKTIFFAQPRFMFYGEQYAEIWSVIDSNYEHEYRLIRYKETNRIDSKKFIDGNNNKAGITKKVEIDIQRDFSFTTPSQLEYIWREPGHYYIFVHFYNDYFDQSFNTQRFEVLVTESNETVYVFPEFESNTFDQLQDSIFTNRDRAFAATLAALMLPFWYSIVIEVLKRKHITRKTLLRSIYIQCMFATPLVLAFLMVFLSIVVFLPSAEPFLSKSKFGWLTFDTNLSFILFTSTMYIGCAVLTWYIVTESQYIDQELTRPRSTVSFLFAAALLVFPVSILFIYLFSNIQLISFTFYNIMSGALLLGLVFKKVIPSIWLWLVNTPKNFRTMRADLYFNRGILRSTKDNIEGAISDWSKAVRLNPSHAHAYNFRGLAHIDRGELQVAISDFNNAITLKPEVPLFYYHRGFAREQYGDLNGAIDDFNIAIHLNENYYEAYFDRASILRKKRKYDLAINDYEKYLELSGGEQNNDKDLVAGIINELNGKLEKNKSLK